LLGFGIALVTDKIMIDTHAEEILAAVMAFADNAHGTQTRKYSGDKYIVHPIRVMKTCRQYTHDIAMLAAALMHDVLEDTPVTEQDIRTFLAGYMDDDTVNRTLTLVVELTDVYVKDKYPNLNRRARKAKEVERLQQTSPDAQLIKYADIIDNCFEIVTSDRDFARVFLYECRNLLAKMDSGNAELYIRAQNAVNDGIKQLKSQSM
jgi:(p)ppGpp synthase/HD superfamily hydrolase